MGTVLAFSLSASLILMLAYGAYRLGRGGSFGRRRAILLSIYASALIIPLALPLLDFNSAVAETEILPPTLLPGQPAMAESALPSASAFSILLRIYAVGTVLCSLLTLVQLMRLGLLLRKSRKCEIAGHTALILNRPDLAPFSIGRVMVLNTADSENPAIIAHEAAHIAARHHIDLSIAQLVAIVCWYCPAAWMMRRELKTIHEFQADRATIGNGAETDAYCRLLIERAARRSIANMASGLSHSNLKRRIRMMQTPETRSGKVRILLSAVALGCAASLLVSPAVSNAIDRISQTVLDETKKPTASFIVYGTNTPVAKGNGTLLPHIGGVLCTDKSQLERLSPKIEKYLIDNKPASAKQLARIPASDLRMVIISGNTMQVRTVRHFDSDYFNPVKTAESVEKRLSYQTIYHIK